MRAQQNVGVALHEERILHVTGRMLWGEVQSAEHMPVVFNFGALCHGKAHVLKDVDDFPTHDLKGVMRTQGHTARGTCGIHARGLGTDHSGLLGFRHALLDGLLQGVKHGADFALLISRDLLERRHQILHLPLAAQIGDAEIFHGLGAGQLHAGHLGQHLFNAFFHGLTWLS